MEVGGEEPLARVQCRVEAFDLEVIVVRRRLDGMIEFDAGFSKPLRSSQGIGEADARVEIRRIAGDDRAPDAIGALIVS